MGREKQIIEAARSYLGVPFMHQGRSRAGVDCLGLLVCVARDCALSLDGKLLTQWDEGGYGHFPDELHLQSRLKEVLAETTDIVTGGVLLLQHDGRSQHLAIVGQDHQEGQTLIHAYAPARCVVEHRLDESWKRRIAGRFVWAD